MLELLIVDDDEMLRESLAMLFRREGFAVTTAASGEAALEAATRQTFDIMISDIRMPGANGIETIERVRSLQPATHFVLITGYASEDAPIQALRLRVDDYFRKPFDLPVFVDRIRAIGRSRLRTGPDATQGLRRFAEVLQEAWPPWGEHARQVAGICDALGRHLDLPESDRVALRLAALYHDLRNVEGERLPPAAAESESAGVLERAAAILAGSSDLTGRVLTAVLAHQAGAAVDDEMLREALAACVGIAAAAPVEAPVRELPPLVLQTLGELSLRAEGDLVTRADWESSSARNLFLFLLCDRGRRVSEDRILEALWPAAETEKARRALKTSVYRVRKALRSPDAITTGDRYYRFNTELPYWWDVDAMEQSARQAESLEKAHDASGALKAWRQAAALYRGPFLEGLEHEWLHPLRDAAAGLALRAQTRGAELALEAGDASASQQAARAALSLDRTCEDAHTVLIRALVAAGRRDDAVRAYHTATEVLQRELGLGPGPHLMRAYLEINTR